MKERKRLARASVIETVMTVCESGAVWTRKPSDVTPLFTSSEGEELIQQALDRKQGVILIVPHLGNWEIANYHISSRYPFMAMYAPVPIPKLDQLIFKARSQMDAEFVPADRWRDGSDELPEQGRFDRRAAGPTTQPEKRRFRTILYEKQH
ncbi:MAG: hypothetical protein R3F47_13430 [Gammaproteobacteria bacterium]